MAKTSWYNPSAVFTNNDVLVTVANEGNTISNPSMYKNGFITAEGFTVEVDYVYYNGTTLTIVLHEGWPGGGGTFGIRMFPGAGAIAGTAIDLATLAQLYEELATSASATAVADSVGLRTSTGAFKVNDANNLDEAVNLGQLGTVHSLDYYNGDFKANVGEVLRQGHFGLGINATPPTMQDLDSPLTPSGYYLMTANVTNAGSRPAGFNGYGTIVIRPYVTGQISQDYLSIDNERATRWYNANTSSWTDWVVSYDSGNSVNPLDYGIGIYYNENAALKNQSNEDDLPSGLYTAYSPNNVNASIGNAPKPTDGGAYSLLNMQGVSPDARYYTTQLATLYDPSITSMYFRTRASAGFSDWNEIYHSKNTNFNEVLGDSTTGLVLWGQAYNSSEIRFYVPIFKNKVATGITVQGTFSLSYYQNPILSGVGGGSGGIEFLSSSRNIAVIRIAGLSNLDLSRQYNVFAEQSSAKITVNF